MEQFLTAKGRRKPWWQIALLLLEIPIAAITVQTCIQQFDHSNPLVSWLASICTVALFLSPGIAAVVSWFRGSVARRVARLLALLSAPALSFNQVGRALHLPLAGYVLRKLNAHKYLRNVIINAVTRQIIPTVEIQKEATPQPSGPDLYQRQLLALRQLNDRIDDEAVSAQIDSIEAVLGSIFQVIAQKPERTDEIRKLMNYYLPTTYKLLSAYSAMEKQPVQSDTLATSRKSIEACLGSIQQALSRQLENLYQQDALDLDTDIQVMKTMMTSDGLLVPEDMPTLRRGAGRQ